MALLKFMNFYIISLTLIAIYSVICMHKLDRLGKWVALLIILGAIAEYGHFTMGYYFRNSMPVAHIGLIITTAVYTKVYYDSFKNRKWANGIGILGAGTIVFLVINSLFINDLNSWPVNSIMATNFLIVFFSLAQFTEMIKYPSEGAIEKQAIFWFSTANLIFYSSSHIYMALYEYNKQNELRMSWMYNLLLVIGLAYYVVYFFVLRLSMVSKKQNPSLIHG